MALYEYIPPLLLGFLGGFHCVGMCGGIIASVSIGSERVSWLGMVIYQFSRIATYIFLGMVATTVGIIFLKTGAFAGGQKLLSLTAGVLIIFLAMQIGGWIPEKFGFISKVLKIPLSALKGARERGAVYYWILLGIFNGLLPCGLVYAALAMALEKADLFYSAVLMLLFGLGTTPWLFGVAWAIKKIEPSSRNRFIKIAAVAMVLFGFFLILKSTPLLTHSLDHSMMDM